MQFEYPFALIGKLILVDDCNFIEEGLGTMQGWKYLFITWKLNEKGEWKFDEASDDQVKRGYESYDIAGAARGLGLERWELISINIYPVPSAHESVQVMLTTFKQPITG